MSTSTTTPAEPGVQRYRGRIHGIDIARGLAILGMIWAHVRPAMYSEGTLAYFLADIPLGRSSALFALLAGISLAILSGRNVVYTGEQLRHAQLRIAGRAVVLLGFSAFLSNFPTIIAVILGFYAAWFLLAIPLLSWSARKLAIAAGVTAVVGPQLIFLLEYLSFTYEIFADGGPNAFLYDVLVAGAYPGLAYMAYVLVGMAIGRTDLTAPAARIRLLVIGLPLAVVGYGSAYLATSTIAPEVDVESMTYSPDLGPFTLWDFLTAEPHTNTTPSVIGNLGFGIALLALCLWLGPLAKHVLFPISAVGSMSLTAYVGHAFGLHFKEEWFYTESATPFLAVAGLVVLFCTLWALLPFRRGPLEWVTYRFSQWFARPTPARAQAQPAEPTRPAQTQPAQAALAQPAHGPELHPSDAATAPIPSAEPRPQPAKTPPDSHHLRRP